MNDPEHVHLVGIGGTGMTALAVLLQESGSRVTGSDGPLYPPTSTILRERGIPVGRGFHPEHLDPPPDLTVIGNAVRRGNPEAEAVLDRGLRYTSMPRLLEERWLESRESWVVAGTHGKTSTSSMLAAVLSHAGLDPGFFIGGWPADFEAPARIGRGPFVVEGDEYDSAFFDKAPKFMHYRPRMAVLGPVEFDHADIYRDLDDVVRVFRWFANLLPRKGLLAVCVDSPQAVACASAGPSRRTSYGLDPAATWTARVLEQREGWTSFEVLYRGRGHLKVRWSVLGAHQAANAAAVTALASDAGVGAATIAEGLERFRGVRRRLEFLGEAGGVRIYLDFAHHPTAIRAALSALRRSHPNRRVVAVLEPRSGSMRRRVFQDILPEALAESDAALLAPVFRPEDLPAGDRLDVAALAEVLRAKGRRAFAASSLEELFAALRAETRPGDLVVFMSNGRLGGLPERLLEALRPAD